MAAFGWQFLGDTSFCTCMAAVVQVGQAMWEEQLGQKKHENRLDQSFEIHLESMGSVREIFSAVFFGLCALLSNSRETASLSHLLHDHPVSL